MSGRLQAELRMQTPFRTAELEAFLGLVRTADGLLAEANDLLTAHDLTTASYNVLRILRGAGDDGLPCGEIGARMVARAPDITRLIDRLVARRLVSRGRDRVDRRVVRVRLAAAGAALLARIGDRDLDALHARQFRHLRTAEVRTLIDLLERIRAHHDEGTP